MRLVDKNLEIEALLKEPKLWDKTYGQDRSIDKDKWHLPADHYYLACKNQQEELLCVYEWTEFTKVCMYAHIYTNPRCQDGITPVKCTLAAMQWMRLHTGYQSIMTSVPVTCLHVHRFLNRMHFQECGEIKNGVIYNGLSQTLILYSKVL